MKNLLEQAIEAVNAGDKVTARTLLLRFLKLHPESERAWFWLAQAVTSLFSTNQNAAS